MRLVDDDLCSQCRGMGVWPLTVIDCASMKSKTHMQDCWCQDG